MSGAGSLNHQGQALLCKNRKRKEQQKRMGRGCRDPKD